MVGVTVWRGDRGGVQSGGWWWSERTVNVWIGCAGFRHCQQPGGQVMETRWGTRTDRRAP